MADGFYPLFYCRLFGRHKKAGSSHPLHAQMSLSIGSQSTSKKQQYPSLTLPTACALMFMEGAGEGTRVSFAFLRRRVERRLASTF